MNIDAHIKVVRDLKINSGKEKLDPAKGSHTNRKLEIVQIYFPPMGFQIFKQDTFSNNLNNCLRQLNKF